MKITILDMDTAALDGDIPLDRLASLGELRVVGETDPARTAALIGDAQAVICNKSRITREVLAQCPALRYVGLMGTGYDQVDLAAAASHGVTVCNVPAYSSGAVAQHTFALILDHFCRISAYAADCAAGGWTEKRYFSVFGRETHELAGKTIGLVGCGGIGRRVAALAQAFDMRVLATVRRPETLADLPGVRCVLLDELLRSSDVVSIHCPLTEETRGLIDGRALSLMQPDALLVNTARGAIVEEAALAQALNEGRVAGAALDVLTEEPMSPDTPLRGARNLLLTPHIAWAPVETRRRLFDTVYDNLAAWMDGCPQNTVV